MYVVKILIRNVKKSYFVRYGVNGMVDSIRGLIASYNNENRQLLRILYIFDGFFFFIFLVITMCFANEAFILLTYFTYGNYI